MHVAIVDPLLGYVRGGAETNDINLGNGFVSAGHKVTYFDVRDDRLPYKPYTSQTVSSVHMAFLPHSIKWVQTVLPYLYRLSILQFYDRFWRRLIDTQKDFLGSLDAILLTGKPVLCSIAKHTSTPVVFSVRGLVKPRNEKHIKNANGVIFWGGCENDNKANLIQQLKILKLDPAIEEGVFHRGEQTPEVRRGLLWQESDMDTPLLVYVGRLESVQQVDSIIRATLSLNRRGTKCHLAVVGDGTKRRELERLTQSRAIGRYSITFTGRQSPGQIGKILRSSDIFVLASKFENHPISLREAVACGLFAVAPDSGRVREIISMSGFGTTYGVNDFEELEKTLCHVINKRAYRKPACSLSCSHRLMPSWHDNAVKIAEFLEREFINSGCS